MTDEQLQHLHDRATRGDDLTAEEQNALDEWYARQDQAESQLLQQAASDEAFANLHVQVTAAANQLEVVTQHIRDVIADNEQLRDEIRMLQRQLAQQVANRAA
jgi:predicted  nucleic acid-binding Zn-ribbon protein